MSKTNKQKILEAAATLFKEKGYVETSMRDLAQHIGLKASSLYNHISSKQEILQLICISSADKFTQHINNLHQQPITPVEKLTELVRFHIQTAMEDTTSVISFTDVWRHLEKEDLQQFIDNRRQYENSFKEIIVDGIDQGHFVNIHPDIALQTILSAVHWIYDWYRPTRSISRQELETNILTLVLQGMQR